MRCYKYMNFERGVEVLNTGSFRLSSISYFNDPFDGYGVSIGSMTDEACWYFVKRFRNELQRLFIEACSDANSQPSKTLIEASNEEYVYILQETFKNPKQSYFTTEAIREWVCGQQFQLMCMSSVENYNPSYDILMWSHYADACKGIRLEIEISNEDLLPGFSLRKMRYSPKRPSLDLSKVRTWDNADSAYMQYLDNCICTKSDVWQYESEVRFVAEIENCKANIAKQHDSRGNFDYACVTFPSNVIKKVFFGCSADRNAVMDLCKDLKCKNKFSNVSFFQMELDLKDYNVMYNEI